MSKREALICGSFAYDTIMVFPGRFQEHILPDALHTLNVAFMVPGLRREFGGCAGNIAWNLQRLLPDCARPMGTVGTDFAPYADWLRQQGIRQEWIREVADHYTAQAFITTDRDNNQITAFHPGAMDQAQRNRIRDLDTRNIALAILAPDGREGMLQHARECQETGIPFLFDPGQGLPMYSGAELRHFIEQAHWMVVNDYEWQIFQSRSGFTLADCSTRLEALIVTRGSKGSYIHRHGKCQEIAAVVSEQVVDPTGCGDAYRAGLLYGLLLGLDWQTTGRVASLLAAIKTGSAGTQNHHFTAQQFHQRFAREFGCRLDAPQAQAARAAG